MILYKNLGLDAKDAAEIMADLVEMIVKKLSDEEITSKLAKKYTDLKLCFAALTLGRLIGMSFALKYPEKARAILSDFSRFSLILKNQGKERLIKVVEREILEETFKDVEKLKDAF